MLVISIVTGMAVAALTLKTVVWWRSGTRFAPALAPVSQEWLAEQQVTPAPDWEL